MAEETPSRGGAMPTSQNYTPKQIARALGVSESSLKRWCDRGILPTIRTAGGHRRIPLTAVLEYLRGTGRPLVRPEILGLPATSGTGLRVIDRARDRLRTALLDGDLAICRQVIFDLFLARHPISAIGDRVIGPAFYDIGASWESGEIEVYQERRACEIIERVLHELEMAVPQGADSTKLALGCTPEGDTYALATALVALVMRQKGWQAISLGAGLPFDTMLSAIRKQEPRLFWLSASHIPDEARFIAEYDAFYQEASRLVWLAVGGRALHHEIRTRIQYTVFCDRLSHLEAFVDAQ